MSEEMDDFNDWIEEFDYCFSFWQFRNDPEEVLP